MTNIVTLLEQLAHCAQFDLKNKMIDSLPYNLQNAFSSNDAETLKKQLSNTESFAHESHVFKFD